MATVNGETSITLDWDAPDNFPSGGEYQIEYGETGGSVTTSTTRLTSRTITGLASGTEYTFRVATKDAGGDLSAYVSTTATTSATASFTAPTDFSVAATSTPGELSCTWGEPENFNSATDQYHLRYRQSGTATWTNVPSITTTSSTLTGLAHGVAYEVEVRAQYRDSDGNDEGYSTFVSGTATTDAYDAPASFTVAATSTGGELSCSWAAPSDFDTTTGQYSLRHKQDSEDDTAWTYVTVSGSGTSHTLTGLSEGVLYDVEVRTVHRDASQNVLAYGVWASATGTPAITPTYNVPTNFSVAASEYAGYLSCSWDEPSGFDSDTDSYQLQYRETSDTIWVNASPTGSSHHLYVISQGGAFTVRVRAHYYDSSDNLEGSSEWVSGTATTLTFGQPTSFTAAPTSTVGELACSWSAPSDFDASTDEYSLR